MLCYTLIKVSIHYSYISTHSVYMRKRKVHLLIVCLFLPVITYLRASHSGSHGSQKQFLSKTSHLKIFIFVHRNMQILQIIICIWFNPFNSSCYLLHINRCGRYILRRSRVQKTVNRTRPEGSKNIILGMELCSRTHPEGFWKITCYCTEFVQKITSY